MAKDDGRAYVKGRLARGTTLQELRDMARRADDRTDMSVAGAAAEAADKIEADMRRQGIDPTTTTIKGDTLRGYGGFVIGQTGGKG